MEFSGEIMCTRCSSFHLEFNSRSIKYKICISCRTKLKCPHNRQKSKCRECEKIESSVFQKVYAGCENSEIPTEERVCVGCGEFHSELSPKGVPYKNCFSCRHKDKCPHGRQKSKCEKCEDPEILAEGKTCGGCGRFHLEFNPEGIKYKTCMQCRNKNKRCRESRRKNICKHKKVRVRCEECLNTVPKK